MADETREQRLERARTIIQEAQDRGGNVWLNNAVGDIRIGEDLMRDAVMTYVKSIIQRRDAPIGDETKVVLRNLLLWVESEYA